MRVAKWPSFDTLWEAVQAVDRQFDGQLNEREWLVNAIEAISMILDAFKKNGISQNDLSDFKNAIAGIEKQNAYSN